MRQLSLVCKGSNLLPAEKFGRLYNTTSSWEKEGWNPLESIKKKNPLDAVYVHVLQVLAESELLVVNALGWHCRVVCIECLVGDNGCQVAVTQWRIGLLSFPHMIMPSWEEEVSLQIVFLVLSYPYFMHQHTSTTTVVKCSSYLARCHTILIQDIYSKQRNSNPLNHNPHFIQSCHY